MILPSLLFPLHSPQAPFFKEKLKLLQQEGISNDGSFELVYGRLNERLLTALRVQRLDDITEFQKRDKGTGVVNVRNEAIVLESLIGGLQGMLEAYPSTLMEDLKLLKQKDTLIVRRQCILHLQISEKKILLNNLQLLQQKQSVLMQK